MLVLVALLMGCSQNTVNNLWKLPRENVHRPVLTLTPSSNITIHLVGNHSTYTDIAAVNGPVNSTANNTRNNDGHMLPPGWTKYNLVYARVGWGHIYVHPFIICVRNNSGSWVLWLNKSVQTTHDVLKYIYHQRWVWINWSNATVWLNGTYFRIIAWMKPRHGVEHTTKYWRVFWERELEYINHNRR